MQVKDCLVWVKKHVTKLVHANKERGAPTGGCIIANFSFVFTYTSAPIPADPHYDLQINTTNANNDRPSPFETNQQYHDDKYSVVEIPEIWQEDQLHSNNFCVGVIQCGDPTQRDKVTDAHAWNLEYYLGSKLAVQGSRHQPKTKSSKQITVPEPRDTHAV